MVTHLVKHINSEGATPNRILASRTKGAIDGKVKPAMVYKELEYEYEVIPDNGEESFSVKTKFPSGKYDALDFTPIAEGYRFIGWFDRPETVSDSIPNMDGEITADMQVMYSVKKIYARWQAPTRIDFNAEENGGVMPEGWEAPLYFAGQPFGELPRPTHETLNFCGWYDEDGVKVTPSRLVPEGGVTLVAQYVSTSYEVDLNGEWLLDESLNPDSSMYEGVYQSFSNTGYEDTENNEGSIAKMYIRVNGYTNFRILIASNSEIGYDFVVAMQPDVDPEYPPYTDIWYDEETGEDRVMETEEIKDGTPYNTYADPMYAGDYKAVDYELDGGEHFICIVYRKDSSVDGGNDCGYVIIPKEQG